MVPLSQTQGIDPNTPITIYRGAPNTQHSISAGDFITTNPRLAADYAGTGHIIQTTVPAAHILDDASEPLGEEYIYRPA